MSVGANINEFTGCYDFSNPVTVNRIGGENCDEEGCGADAGMVSFEGGGTDTLICQDDWDNTIPLVRSVRFLPPGILGFIVLADENGNVTNGIGGPGIDFIAGTETLQLPDIADGSYQLHYIAADPTTITQLLEEGGPVSDLMADCIDFANVITFTAVSGDDCPSDDPCADEEVGMTGNITFVGGVTDTTYCGDVAPGTTIGIEQPGLSGEDFPSYIVTDATVCEGVNKI